MANKRNGALYTGMTNDLARRVQEHKAHAVKGFTQKYDVGILVWYVQTEDVYVALEFEKKIKNRKRAFKVSLIERENPEWDDLEV
jgi:putative endonuclease